MKRFFLFVLSLALAVGAHAASIKVTYPNGALGEPWCTGNSNMIRWTKDGTMPDTVKITLRNSASGAEIMSIADNAPNSGSYQWAIPTNIADGQYVVRVKVKGVAIQDDSEAFFVSSCPTITITEPHEGAKWMETNTYTITWTKTGNMPATVMIRVFIAAGGSAMKVIALSASNSGSYSWTVPGDLAIGKYKILIDTSNPNVNGYSGVFNIGLAKMLTHAIIKK